MNHYEAVSVLVIAALWVFFCDVNNVEIVFSPFPGMGS